MSKEAPFDVWDGEELGLSDEVHDIAAEEVAMHVDPESDPNAEAGPHWSELTEGDDLPGPEAPPVTYFADEDPDVSAGAIVARTNGDDRPVDLEELLERQHYSFRQR